MPSLRFVKNAILSFTFSPVFSPIPGLGCLAAMAMLWPAPALAQAGVAWLEAGQGGSGVQQVQVRALGQGAAPVENGVSRVALGSLWKLFVYAYLVDTQAQEAPYACSARKVEKEDKYCCDPGGSVDRNLALARSCAPYFSLQRLGVSAGEWQAWQRAGSARNATDAADVANVANAANAANAANPPPPSWLLDVKRLQPATEVPLQELLQALDQFSPAAKAAARSALLETGVAVYGREAWTRLGTGMRYKTYSWHDRAGNAFGGAAGWLVDGTPFWFGGPGSSRFALPNWASAMAAALPVPRWQQLPTEGQSASCVDVDFFARYPLRSVSNLSGAKSVPAPAGRMQGRYRLQFVNGNTLEIQADGQLKLAYARAPARVSASTSASTSVPRISARMGLNQYVARVVLREGDASATQAARALAIAARSYLLQNGQFGGACWQIADSSQTQRVSPNPPNQAALDAAWFTDEMVLQGVSVHYHSDQPGTNRLAWRAAVEQAGQGWDFERILLHAFPQATLGSFNGHSECVRLSAAENWLTQAAERWRAKLGAQAGFEYLSEPPKVCSLAEGHPYSDQGRLRIYVRGWQSLDQRITLAHEYLHLAFRFHPRGADETYIERWARRLINEAVEG